MRDTQRLHDRAMPRSRRETAAALRRIARDGTLKYKELEASMRRAVLLYWGSMTAARDALGIRRLPAPRQSWSRKRVIDEIRSLSRRGKHLSMSAMRDGGHNDLVVAACTYVGSWTRARDAAGVAFKRKRPKQTTSWDGNAVVAEIRRRRDSGLELAVTKCPRSLVSAANRIFGSWRAAIEAAGIDYDDVTLLRTYDDEELLAWLRELARRNPDMSPFEIDQHGEHAVACRRRWGSYEAAAAAAGLVDWPTRKRNAAVTRAKVLRLLRERRDAKLSMRFKAVENSEGGSLIITSVLHHFARWADALEAAGIRA